MKFKCPQCGRPIYIPIKEVKWLVDAKKRNKDLKLICSKCGDRQFAEYPNG